MIAFVVSGLVKRCCMTTRRRGFEGASRADRARAAAGDVRCRLLPAEHAAAGVGRPKRRCVTEVTSRRHPQQYGSTRIKVEEVTMTAAVKKTSTRLVRWFEEFRRKNRPPYKWYEHDLYGG